LLTLIKTIEKDVDSDSKFMSIKDIEEEADNDSEDKIQEMLDDRSGKKLEQFIVDAGEVIRHLVNTIRRKCEVCMSAKAGDECLISNCPIWHYTQYRQGRLEVD